MNDLTRRDGTRSIPKTSEAQPRLQKLEEMVTGLLESSGKELEADNDRRSRTSGTANKQSQSLSIRASPHTHQSPVKGHLDYDGSEVNYLGATHRATILETVRSPVFGWYLAKAVLDSRHPGRPSGRFHRYQRDILSTSCEGA